MSHRRVRTLEIYSLIMGLVWTVISWLMLSASVFKVIPLALVVFIAGGGTKTHIRFVWENWRCTVSNTKLRVESVEAEAERARVLEKVSSQLGTYMSPQLYASISTIRSSGPR